MKLDHQTAQPANDLSEISFPKRVIDFGTMTLSGFAGAAFMTQALIKEISGMDQSDQLGTSQLAVALLAGFGAGLFLAKKFDQIGYGDNELAEASVMTRPVQRD